MKRFLLFLILFTGFIFLNNQSKGQADTSNRPELIELKNYFVKNNAKLSKSKTHYLVISGMNKFNGYFSPAKTMNNTIITPTFGDNIVLAIVLPVSDKDAEVMIEKAEIKNDILKVYCKTTTKGTNTYKSRPLALYMVHKNPVLRFVHFYEGDKLLKYERVNSAMKGGEGL